METIGREFFRNEQVTQQRYPKATKVVGIIGGKTGRLLAGDSQFLRRTTKVKYGKDGSAFDASL